MKGGFTNQVLPLLRLRSPGLGALGAEPNAAMPLVSPRRSTRCGSSLRRPRLKKSHLWMEKKEKPTQGVVEYFLRMASKRGVKWQTVVVTVPGVSLSDPFKMVGHCPK